MNKTEDDEIDAEELTEDELKQVTGLIMYILIKLIQTQQCYLYVVTMDDSI